MSHDAYRLQASVRAMMYIAICRFTSVYKTVKARGTPADDHSIGAQIMRIKVGVYLVPAFVYAGRELAE